MLDVISNNGKWEVKLYFNQILYFLNRDADHQVDWHECKTNVCMCLCISLCAGLPRRVICWY